MMLKLSDSELERIVFQWAKSAGLQPIGVLLYKEDDSEDILCEIDLDDCPEQFVCNRSPVETTEG